MAACGFYTKANGKTAQEAFDHAVKDARYDYGHAGYTGTIAEKNDFVVIDLPDGETAEKYATHLVNNGDDRIDDKWGPAGCISLGNDEWLFFGWASF